MKEVAIGIAAVLTAIASVGAFLFDMYWGDTTKLQEKIVRKDRAERKATKEQGEEVEGAEIDEADAAMLATKRRSKAKLRLVGAVLVLALIANVAAFFLSESNDSRCAAACPKSHTSTIHEASGGSFGFRQGSR